MKKVTLLVTLILSTLMGSTLLAGDAAAGKNSYAMCGACHGMKGEGVEAMKAPRLAGQGAWYIASSLERFKSGVRGAGDPVAASMVPMAKMLTEQQIADVAAYIATL